MKKKILITGGAGNIGYQFYKSLDNSKYTVTVFDAKKIQNRSNVDFIKGDITNRKNLASIIARVDGIVHLAAVSRVSDANQDPYRCLRTNVDGLINILEIVRNSNRKPWLILSSSQEVNFDWHKLGMNQKIGWNNNIYGISKLISEMLCNQYSQTYNLKTMVLRFSYVYGMPHDNPHKFIPQVVSKAIKNERITITHPHQEFDFIYYEDLIEAMIAAVEYMSKNKSGNEFHCIPLCTGKSTTLKQVVRLIVDNINSHSSIDSKNQAPISRHDRNKCSTEMAKKILKFKAKHSVSDGIKKTIRDFQRSH